MAVVLGKLFPGLSRSVRPSAFVRLAHSSTLRFFLASHLWPFLPQTGGRLKLYSGSRLLIKLFFSGDESERSRFGWKEWSGAPSVRRGWSVGEEARAEENRSVSAKLFPAAKVGSASSREGRKERRKQGKKKGQKGASIARGMGEIKQSVSRLDFQLNMKLFEAR